MDSFKVSKPFLRAYLALKFYHGLALFADANITSCPSRPDAGAPGISAPHRAEPMAWLLLLSGVCVCVATYGVRSSAPDSSVTLKDLVQSICILKYPNVITDEPNWKPSSPSLLAKVDKGALFDLESGFNVVDKIELSGSWSSGIQRRKQPAGQYLAYALNKRPFALVQTWDSYFGRPRSRDQPRVMLLAALVG